MHAYGCRVIQRILEFCPRKYKVKEGDGQVTKSYTECIYKNILKNVTILTNDQYGNYVIQHVLEKGTSIADKDKIADSLKDRVLDLSVHKFASNVVEKCIEYASLSKRKSIIDEIIGDYNDSQPSNALYKMMKDKYGNYVVQKALEQA